MQRCSNAEQTVQCTTSTNLHATTVLFISTAANPAATRKLFLFVKVSFSLCVRRICVFGLPDDFELGVSFLCSALRQKSGQGHTWVKSSLEYESLTKKPTRSCKSVMSLLFSAKISSSCCKSSLHLRQSTQTRSRQFTLHLR